MEIKMSATDLSKNNEAEEKTGGKSCCPTTPEKNSATSSCCPPTPKPEVTRTTSSCCSPTSMSESSQDLASAVEFANNRRIHISLNVKDVKRSVNFYRVLFDQNPTNMKSDYAKFEPEQPPVNFTINEHDDEIVDNDGHFGIELKSVEAVDKALTRIASSGIKVEATETQVACCHSVQDKGWVVDPDGNHWEFFVVTENEAEEGCGLTCICYDPETDGCNWKKRA